MAGESVAQDMRRDARRIEASRQRERFEELAAAAPGQVALGAAGWKEKARGRTLGEKFATYRRIVGERLTRRRAKRHQPLLAALAGDEKKALVAQPPQRQRDELGDAQPGGVKQLDEADQPLALGTRHLPRRGDERLDLRLGEELRQRAAEPGRIELSGRVVAADALGEEEFVELAQRREPARRRAGRHAGPDEPAEVTAQCGSVGGFGRFAGSSEEGGEIVEIVAIGGNGQL